MLRRLRVWARALARRRTVEREMQDEMQSHLARATERLVARGVPIAQARVQARREFGNVASIEEEARDARGVRWIEDAAQDLRYAVRSLRRKPGFALAIVTTLALGVGANATMFSVVDRLFFRSPAYLIAPERSHHLYYTRFRNGTETVGIAFPYQRFLDLTSAARTMDVIAAYSPRRLAVGTADNLEEVQVGAASASFWRLFNARPAVGRFFTADEDKDPNGARVAVLSYAYWQARYGGSPSVIGATLVITPARYTIIGVAPAGFVGVDRQTPGVFIPITVGAADDFGRAWERERAGYSTSWMDLYGRRKAGTSVETATADLSAAFVQSYRKQLLAEPQYTAPLEAAKPRMVLSSMLAERGPRPSADARVARWLFGVSAIVLLIACANVGNLLLARALTRQREIAVRLALGVSRARLVRYLLLESLSLACAGGFAGLVLAQYGGHLLQTFLLPDVDWASVLAEPRTLVFAAFSIVVVGIGAGIVPIIQSNRYDVTAALKSGGRDGHGHRSTLRTALILVQVTLSAILLIGAGLFVKSVERVAAMDIGYDVNRLVLVDLHTRSTELDSAGEAAVRQALIERAERNPNVEAVTFACSAPFSGTCAPRIFVTGVDSTNRLGEFVKQHASPAYFRTVGTRLLRGRVFTTEDRGGSPLVAVVSESMARVLWPGREAIGQCFRIRADTAPCRTVVGIAQDVTQEEFGARGGLEYYIPAAQDDIRPRLLVRVRGDPEKQAEELRRDLTSAIPASTYLSARPMPRIVGGVTRSWQLGALMFAAFGLLALIVAAVGLYSVVAYDVAQRRHEVGVRIALGARVHDIVRLIVSDGVRVAAGGVAIGAGLTLLGARWVGPLLFQVSPRDPVVLGSVGLVLLIVAVAASGVPALQASRVDPARSLRSD